MEKVEKDWLGPVLKKYRLRPEFIESFGNVHKVITKSGTFALKELKNPNQIGFPQLIQQLYQRGYTRIAPILKTDDGQYFVFYQNQVFYLMPWLQGFLNEDRSVHQNRMLRELARLHYVSAQKVPIKKEELIQTYENISNEWNRKMHFLEEYIEICEKKWYMSPFELQYCTYFHETMQAAHFALDHYKRWYELVKEKTDTRVVVNHGNLSYRNFVYDQNESGVFISFDHANYTLPIYDLIRYFHRILRTYPVECNECREGYNHYQKHFPYTEEEKALFLSYLVFPEQIYRTITKYESEKKPNERNFVKRIQKDYWQMKNIEYLVMQIPEENTAEQEEGANS